MSHKHHEVETAVQSAIDECCQSFAAGIDESDEAALERALQTALLDPAQFEASLEQSLRAIDGLTIDFDKAAILKIIGDLWDNYVQPWNVPAIPDLVESQIKAFARSVALYVAGVVLNRIWGT